MRASRIIFALISGMITLAVFQVDVRSQEQLWLNLPTSPLRIERSPNGRFLTLSNYSSKKAIKYRLGCVVKTDDRIKIIGKKKVYLITLEPIDAVTNQVSFIPFDVAENDINRCSNRDARLAVIEVSFADDSTWKINNR